MLITFGLFLLSIIHTALAQQNPFIQFITKEIITDIGSTVELKCSVQFTFGYPVLWMHQSIISADATRIIPDTRYSVRYEEGSSTYILQIMDIQETDAGIYFCKILLSAEKRVEASVFLGVRQPPIITDDSSRDISVAEGADVNLFCDARGYPEPEISWRRVGNGILPTGGFIYRGKELKIFKITKEDRGIYACVAENGMSKADRRNVAIKVEFKPQITVPRKKVGQAFQYDMEMECIVEAFPAPAITWVFNGHILSNDMHYAITIFLGTNELTTTKLRAITIEQKQYGVYQCKASNKLGVAVGEVELYETYIPNERFSGDFSPLTGNNKALRVSLLVLFIGLWVALLML